MNLFKRFQKLIPTYPLRVGTVSSVLSASEVLIEEVGGAVLTVRGSASVGQRVYFRNSVIEGLAPNLPVEVIDV